MYLLGYDVGSSSIKAALVDAHSGHVADSIKFPDNEMGIKAIHPGWAEQDPETWWENLCQATRKLMKRNNHIDKADIKGIGIAYQMHGLVLIDKDHHVLRPSIIWCDSRAVDIGNKAFTELGEERCLRHLMNSPGNFTASKLKWVQENEPGIYEKVYKFLLPGDFIAMKITGEVSTTISGLSEGIFWDFKFNEVAEFLLDHFKIDRNLIPVITPTFSVQGELTHESAAMLGLKEGTPVTYRAGDQPNNALSLNVLHPGEVAASGGTSGVLYGIVDRPVFDQRSRVNGFAHVTHQPANPRLGILLCLNGAGIQYSWIKQNTGSDDLTFTEMENIASSIPVGSENLRMIPFGNGTERIFSNRNLGAHIINLQFNIHNKAHLYRAALEGIAFSFVYGMEILKELGLDASIIRAGNDNLFQSEIFSATVATLADSRIEVVETTGAIGAAKAAGVAAGFFSTVSEALQNIEINRVYYPVNDRRRNQYIEAWQMWKTDLEYILTQ